MHHPEKKKNAHIKDYVVFKLSEEQKNAIYIPTYYVGSRYLQSTYLRPRNLMRMSADTRQ